ncbi:Adaptive-response sensory-kinase SasA [bioreactor metagenome]|uniref:histidine kinase n=1 Tax=bioreactor metagenome TaxID=1076179 RepID=A0A644T9M2_9ZZZZ|nr:ATP-binding protein [Desulfitobacterium hafniense]MEA5024174.1 ATP-binding protein [Desulfitobacterium hafniense]
MRLIKRWNTNTIKFKLLAFGIIMSILPFLLLGYVQTNTGKTDLQGTIQRHNIDVAQRVAEDTANLLTNMYNILMTAETLDRESLLNGSWKEKQIALYGILKRSSYFKKISIFAADGTEVAAVSREEVITEADGGNLLSIDFSKLDQEGIDIGPVYFTAKGSPMVDLSIPLKELAENKIVGGLSAQVSLRSVMDKIAALHIGQGAYLFMTDRSGRLIAHEDFSQVLLSQSVLESQIVGEFVKEKDGPLLPKSGQYRSYTDKKVLGVFAPIRGVDWGVFIEQPLDKAFAPITASLVKLLQATAIVIIIVVAISIFFGIRFIRPLEALEQGVRRVREGNLNYMIPEMRAEEEYIELVRTFNTMTKELREKTHSLSSEKERLDTIVNGLGVGLLLVDEEGKIHWSNPQIKKWQMAEKADAFCFNIFNEQNKFCADCPLNDTANFRGVGEDLLTTLNIDGRKRYFKHRVYTLTTQKQREPKYLEIIEDVTEQKELERTMLQTDKLTAVGLLASGVAHEINNPLATVAAYTEYLQEKLRTGNIDELYKSGEFQKNLAMIQKHIARCSGITQKLLNFSRQTNDIIEDIDIDHLVEGTIQLVNYQLKKKNIRLMTSLSQTQLWVRGDYNNLQQALLNLFTNAMDSIDKEGKLKITTSVNQGMVEIALQDNGCGISPEHLSRIFDPFYTTKLVGQGTGLGLSITYGIITKLKGEIKIDSQVGLGTQVTLRIPQKV